MISTEFWPTLAAPLLNGIALLLALGFRRNRAFMVLAILCAASLGLAGFGAALLFERGIEAFRMFAPCLLLAAAAMPERRLLARRNLLLLSLLGLAVWLTLSAPAHIWPGLRDAFPLGWLPWRSGSIAAAIVLIAAAVCVVRWILLRAPMEAALAFILVLVAIALLPITRMGGASELLAITGAIAIAAILFASYRMAFVDGLAGLPNRRALDEELARLSGDFALAMVDVDHFKKFNDQHGHAAGDRALKAVADQLKMTRGANAFRYGGEEFCLLFTGTRVGQASEACEDLRKRVAAMRISIRSNASQKSTQTAKRKDSSEVKVTVSIGLAERAEDLRSATEVLKAADKALYSAKAKGRNRVISN
ncbi:MAG: GGDEF domain-containing protein [Dokdonella sp.]